MHRKLLQASILIASIGLANSFSGAASSELSNQQCGIVIHSKAAVSSQNDLYLVQGENTNPSTAQGEQVADHLKAAKALMSKLNWRPALQELKMFSEHNAKDANCWRLMGVCYMQIGKLTEAKESYQKAKDFAGGKDDVPKFVTEQKLPQKDKSEEQRLSESQAADKKKQDEQIYMTDLRRRVKSNWHPSAPYLSDNVVVTFKVNRQGKISGVKIKTSSGNSECDKAAVDAVSDTTGGPLPEEWSHEIDVQFTFDKLTLI